MNLHLRVWTTAFIGTRSHLDAMLDFIDEFDGGRFRPERWNFYEPLRHVYSKQAREKIAREWTESKPVGSGRCCHLLLMKRLKRQMKLNAECWRSWTAGKTLNSVYLRLTSWTHRARIGEAALRANVEILGACLGCVEPSTQALRRNAVGTPQDSVSQLDWLMYWGDPYLKLIGRDRLLAALWAKFEESPGGGVFTWVTADPNDPALAKTSETQLRIEAAIGRNLFPRDPSEPKCQTPRFDFSELTVRKPKGIRY